MATDYSKTLNLPSTGFSMRANLPEKEPEMLKKWDESGLYKAVLDKNSDRPLFVLHDGPPYANGDIHIGHALNNSAVVVSTYLVKNGIVDTDLSAVGAEMNTIPWLAILSLVLTIVLMMFYREVLKHKRYE